MSVLGAVRNFPFTLVAGPCALETDDVNFGVAQVLQEVGDEFDLPVVFKGSFDKANRTRLTSARGLGINEGLQALARVREGFGLRVLTDVHEPWQVRLAAEVVDVLQVPAFLSRQTDLLSVAGAMGLPVNVKKGQWMDPHDVRHVVEKVGGECWITERGTAFGYGDVVVDMRWPGLGHAPMLFDATHTVRLHADTARLARAAVAAGCDGLYIETHPDPMTAPCDGPRMLPLGELRPLVEQVARIREALGWSPVQATYTPVT